MPAYLMKEAFQEELYLLWSNDRYVLNVNNCIPFRWKFVVLRLRKGKKGNIQVILFALYNNKDSLIISCLWFTIADLRLYNYLFSLLNE